jgi:osmotically-inducible protein OsmY
MDRSICDRIETSIRRVLGGDFPREFQCQESEGVFTISGVSKTKDDATTCGVIARTLPGVKAVKNEIKPE